MTTIAPLPDSTKSLLRSTLIIPSLPSILIELVQNSLDAQSNNVILSFDLDRWTIKCEDDGWGLTRNEMRRVGGERYWTSKLEQDDEKMEKVNTFGFRGEALASLADVGMLEILTRSRRDENTMLDEEVSVLGGESYSLLFRGGERIYNGTAKVKRNSIGTTVWVRDIFYQWPVRRRPLSTPSSRLSTVSCFRTSLATIALMYPLVSFTLIDTSSTSTANTSTPKRLLQVSRTAEDNLGRWKQLWGRAGVEKVDVVDEYEDVSKVSTSSSGKKMKMKGFFSLTAAHSKASQFIYVNSRPISPCHLHKLVNFLFAQSSFSKNSPSHLIDPSSVSPTQDNGTKATRKSPKKVSERFPIFVLNLMIPPGFIDVTLEPEKRHIEFEDPEKVYKFVEKVTKGFLVKNGFSDIAPLKHIESSKSDVIVHDISSTLSVASCSITEIQQLDAHRPADTALTVPTPLALVDPTSLLSPLSLPLPLPLPLSLPFSLPLPSDSSDPSPIQWIDPKTRQTFLIDPRTGNSWRPPVPVTSLPDSPCDCRGDRERERGRNTLVDRSHLRKRQREEVEGVNQEDDEGDGESFKDSTLPEWIAKTFQNWSNPIFDLGSPMVPILPSVSIEPLPPPSKNKSSTFPSNSNFASQSKMKAFFENNLASTSTVGVLSSDVRGIGQKFTREDLKNGVFLTQVDRKFLLVKITNSLEGEDSSNIKETLVMVDQHAADERIRVERYLSDFCGSVTQEGGEGVKIFTFEEPRLMLLSREEVIHLRDYGGKEECKKWGIGIEFFPPLTSTSAANHNVGMEREEEGDYVQVKLTTIPLIVSDRLKSETKLQQELVRSFLAQLIAELGKGRPAGRRKESGPGENNWVSTMRSCPLVLLDLINSKACRGAIMFNDVLTTQQCQTLLSQLAETVNPFQCAHGRPSLVPLINLANSNTKIGGRGGGSKIDWSRLEK